MTSHYTLEFVTTLHDVGGFVGMAFGHFLLGSHNCMVTALGSCVKWPLVEWELEGRLTPFPIENVAHK